LGAITGQRALRLGAHASSNALTRDEAALCCARPASRRASACPKGRCRFCEPVSHREQGARGRAAFPRRRVALYQHPNLMEVGALANEVRERLHGDRTYFNRNLHINPTNVCVASCKLCSFSRRRAADAEGAFVLTSSKRWTSCARAWPRASG
jgi:hypothetical protein